MNFSPHTFELSLKLTQQKYEKLRSVAYANAEGSHRMFQAENTSDHFSVHIDTALASSGIRIEYQDNFCQYSIKLIINPSKVLGGDDIPKLWKPSHKNIEVLIRELEAQIDDYFDSEYELDDFKLSRIDFTVNIDLGSRNKVAQYIKILHNMGRVKGFRQKYKKSDKRINKALSFDLTGKSTHIEFSAYDKEAQCMRKEAKGILRIEIRWMKVETEGNCTSEQIKILSENSREIFMHYFQRIVPRGDYYVKKQALDLIEANIATVIKNTRAMRNMLGKMKELIEFVPEKKSLHLAQKSMNYRHIGRVMKTFSRLHVSPVTLSKNMKLKYLKSLYAYLE